MYTNLIYTNFTEMTLKYQTMTHRAIIIVWRSHTLRTALDITSAVGGPWRRDS